MEAHGSGTTSVRKEITCTDCGHIYFIAQGQPGARCHSCGNIEFLSGPEPQPHASLSQDIALRKGLPRLQKENVEDPLALFQLTPNGSVVEAIRIRYQVEWQLWATLVNHFQDPAHHMAYICQATATHQLELASRRYREHRSVMALLSECRWQAEVAELMLSRIENISLMRLTTGGGGWYTQLPAIFYQMRTDARVMRYMWLTFGIVVFMRVFSLVWWK